MLFFLKFQVLALHPLVLGQSLERLVDVQVLSRVGRDSCTKSPNLHTSPWFLDPCLAGLVQYPRLP